jgi:hypothetical protein
VKRHISNDSTDRNENCRENGALLAGGNDINADLDERIEILGKLPAEGELARI